MLRVFSEGDDLFRLEDDAGAHVGTIRNRTISFRGFATEAAAREAAVAAWRAMNDARAISLTLHLHNDRRSSPAQAISSTPHATQTCDSITPQISAASLETKTTPARLHAFQPRRARRSRLQ